jgi:hypothetical protein
MIALPEGTKVLPGGRIRGRCHLCGQPFEAAMPRFEEGKLMAVKAFLCSQRCMTAQALAEQAAGAPPMGAAFDLEGKKVR